MYKFIKPLLWIDILLRVFYQHDEKIVWLGTGTKQFPFNNKLFGWMSICKVVG